MSKFEILKQTFLGNIGDRIPISLWKHHPNDDRTPEGLVEKEIEFHKTYDHDLLKISFFGHYPCVDFGCDVIYDGAISGSTTLTNAAIHEACDWEVLEPVDVNAGEFGKQVKAVEMIREYAHGVVPTMATIFGGPMVTDKICDKKLSHYMDNNPEIIASALEMITDVMVDFAKATLEAGADGLFIASQHSTYSSVSDEHYKKFILPSNQRLISKLRGKAKFIVMHLHAREDNEQIRFDEIVKTPGLDAINWEDQTSSHSLADGRKISRKAVLGGIDHNGVLRTGTPDEAAEQVTQAVRDAGARSLMVAPGCVITVDTLDENIQSIVDAVTAIDPFENE